MTGFNVHRGVLASFHRKPPRTADEVLAGARRLAILEDVNNHTNLEGANGPLTLAALSHSGAWCALGDFGGRRGSGRAGAR